MVTYCEHIIMVTYCEHIIMVTYCEQIMVTYCAVSIIAGIGVTVVVVHITALPKPSIITGTAVVIDHILQ